jgi:hypothetical protein
MQMRESAKGTGIPPGNKRDKGLGFPLACETVNAF